MSKTTLNKLIIPALLCLFLIGQCQLKAETKNLAATACACDPVADSLQLISLRTATGGDNWTTVWDVDTPVSTWFGVTLNSAGCVDRLYLYLNFSAYVGNNLTGSLPALQLPELTELVLQGNDIGGTLPDFSGMPNLERLNLNANSIGGTFPDFSGNPELRTVAMDGNPVSGSLPDFPNTPLLKTLSCYFCSLSGEIPDFSNVPLLENVYLGRNFLEGEIPDFQFVPQLRILNLTINNLEGDIFDFSNTPVLEELLIGSNNLTGGIPDYQNLPLLRTLEISDNDITGTIPDFSGLPALQNLRLGFNPLSGTIPNFSMLPALKVLDISRANMEGNLPAFFASVGLEKLSVIGNELEGSVPDYSSKPLVTLRIQENNLTDLPDLTALNDWGDFISNGFVAHDNRFTFEDILPNMSAENSGFWQYAPQDSVGETRTEILVPNSDYTIDLEIDEDIADNVYQWYKDGVFLQQLTGENELTLTGLQPSDEGVYTCIITNAGAPALTLYSRPVTLILCVQAADATATDSGSYCTGDAIELFGNVNEAAATEVSYQWTGPNNYTSDAQNPTDATAAGTYTFVAVLDGCPSLPAATTVEIFATPAQPTASTPSSVLCAGETLQLNTPTAAGVSYQWTGPNGFSATTQNPTVSTAAAPPMSGTYSLMLNNNGCLSPAATVDVTVDAVADAGFTYADICDGETGSPSFISTNGGTFTFQNTPTDGATLDAATGEVTNATAGNSYTLVYTLNADAACPSSETQTFSVISNPTAENLTTDCAPDLLTYLVEFSTTATQVNATGGNVINIGGNAWQITDVPANTDIDITLGTVGAAFCETTVSVTAPDCECPDLDAPMAEFNPVEVCEDDAEATLRTEVAAGYTVNWYDAPTGGNLLAANVLNFIPGVSGTYYAETFDPITQCTSETRTPIVFTVFEKPIIDVQAVECNESNATYSVEFYAEGENVTLSEGDLLTISENIYRAENVRDVADLTVRTENGVCETTEFIPVPDCYCARISFIETQAVTCFAGNDGALFIEPGTAYGSPVNILLNGERVRENVALPTVISNLTGGIYDIEIRDADGCVKTEKANIRQPAEPILDLDGSYEIKLGESLKIEPLTNWTDIAEIFWTDNSGTLSCTDCLETVAAPQQTAIYELTLTNFAGCKISETVQVFVNTEIPIFAPTAFSPNNDGANDYFMLFGEPGTVMNIDLLQVYDRWGNQVFLQENLNINEENSGWNGDFRGQDMPNEVYVWSAKVTLIDGRTESLRGSVTLLR